MCIIVVKEKGVALPDRAILINCFRNNSHGAGLMYNQDGQVMIEKGFMSFMSFYQRLLELEMQFRDLKEQALVLHFRIKSYGEISEANTHPYPLTGNTDRMKELRGSCDVALVHNGTIEDYSPKGIDVSSELNDTQVFIRDYLYPLYLRENEFYKGELYKKQIFTDSSEGKFAFLDYDENIETVGGFISYQGCKFSNYSYL